MADSVGRCPNPPPPPKMVGRFPRFYLAKTTREQILLVKETHQHVVYTSSNDKPVNQKLFFFFFHIEKSWLYNLKKKKPSEPIGFCA